MKKDINRRQFLISGSVAIGALAAIGAGVTYLKGKKGIYENDFYLRPPGAIAENDFIYGCIKCGLCVQICPIDAVKLAGIGDGLSYGTPYIDIREQACDFSCDSLQCVETCPTAVLDFKQFQRAGEKAYAEASKLQQNSKETNPFKAQIKAMKAEVKMGVAKLNEGSCLAVAGKGFKGTSRGENFAGVYRTPDGKAKKATLLRERTFDREVCDLCVTECPMGETAIIMEGGKPKILDGCTGCGVCVMVCPTEGPSIMVEGTELI